MKNVNGIASTCLTWPQLSLICPKGAERESVQCCIFDSVPISNNTYFSVGLSMPGAPSVIPLPPPSLPPCNIHANEVTSPLLSSPVPSSNYHQAKAVVRRADPTFMKEERAVLQKCGTLSFFPRRKRATKVFVSPPSPLLNEFLAGPLALCSSLGH